MTFRLWRCLLSGIAQISSMLCDIIIIAMLPFKSYVPPAWTSPRLLRRLTPQLRSWDSKLDLAKNNELMLANTFVAQNNT